MGHGQPRQNRYRLSPDESALYHVGFHGRGRSKKNQPSIVYIYHFSNLDTASLRNLLSGQPMAVRMGASLFYESDKGQAATGILNGRKRTEVPVKKHSGNTGSSRHFISSGGKVSLIDATGRVIQLKNHHSYSSVGRTRWISLFPKSICSMQ